jgi:predicted transcriptional regulator of viral defense system
MSIPYYIPQLQEALPEIKTYFETSDRKVYKQIDLSKILNKHHLTWHIYAEVPVRAFIKYICENMPMKKVELIFGISNYRKETRYLWGDASVFELALSLKSHSYFTHHTAAYFHRLIDKAPKTIYLNSEQSKKLSTSVLTQDAIDMAFRNSVRISNSRTQYENKTICLLNGMHTGQLGVIELIGEKGEKIYLTGIERTLIDIVVRPVYSGGVSEVLNIYRRASQKTSVRHLWEIYWILDYVYPYHQVIGFYLDRAGVYDEKEINLFYKIDKPFNFYLTHKMEKTSYSKKWRLFYPKEFDLGGY